MPAVGVVGEPTMGEIGLPAFVGLFGGEPDVGGFGSLLRLRRDLAGRSQMSVNRRDRHDQSVMVFQMPGNGVGAVVKPFAGELVAELDDQIDRGLRQTGGIGVRPAWSLFEVGLTLDPITLEQPTDPALGNPVGARHLGLAATLHDDGGDNQASFRHPPNIGRLPICDVLRHTMRMS
jgi:hypothetical protein